MTLVAGGCGIGFHRGPYGGCIPNGYGYGGGYGYRGGVYRGGGSIAAESIAVARSIAAAIVGAPSRLSWGRPVAGNVALSGAARRT